MINFHEETNSVFPSLPQLGSFNETTNGRASAADSQPVSKPTSGTQSSILQIEGSELVNNTINGKSSIADLQLVSTSHPIAGIWSSILQIEDSERADAALRIVNTIHKLLDLFQMYGLDINYLPPLRAFHLSDESFLLDWIFLDFRIGFSFEPDHNESGWYLVTNKNLGEIGMSGYLSEIGDMTSFIFWLLSFVRSNS
jgi:hypothetical protein